MENFDTDKFCERAIALFGDSGQMELAEKIGISQGVISAIKNKKVKAPGADTICRLSKYFGVSSDYLLGLAKDPTTDTDLKAVCDYTGLSQESIINICTVTEKENGSGVLSKILENNNFWKIQSAISDAAAQKSYLLPNPTYIIDTIRRKINGDDLPTAYIRALKYVGTKGTAPIFRNELFENITDLFDEITGYNDMLDNGYNAEEGE